MTSFDNVRDGLRASRRLLAVAAISGLLAVTLLARLAGPEYRAEAKVLLGQRDTSAVVGGAPAENDAQLRFATDAALAQTPEFRDRITRRLRLRGELEGDVQVEQESGTSLLTIIGVAADGPRAVDIANAAAAEFPAYRAELLARPVREARLRVERALAAAPGDPELEASLSRLRALESLAGGATVVTRARDALRVRPAPVRDAFVGLIAGLVVGLLVVALREGLARRVRNEQDLEQPRRAATGSRQDTLPSGTRELESGERPDAARSPPAGVGRKALADTDPTLLEDLKALLDGDTRGDRESPLSWTTKGVRQLTDALRESGHRVDFASVAKLLRGLGYSLQSNRRTREGASPADRDAQFEHINQTVRAALDSGQPAISVDTRKKEMVGDARNGGHEWRPTGSPELVRVDDVNDREPDTAIPYGIYDLAEDGWVQVGIRQETAQFAVASIHSWWQHLGRARFPEAVTLTVTVDCGGSSRSRTRLWMTQLQRLADDTSLEIQVCHVPRGTSRWNEIEHRLFSFTSSNGRAEPQVALEVIINLLAATTGRSGLEIYAELDGRTYPESSRVSDAELKTVNLHSATFHPEWNYTVKPRT